MPDKWYTLAGVAELKKTTYPSVRKAVKDKKLRPIIANAGLKKARPVELVTEEQVTAWKFQPHSRLTEDQRIERAATILKMDPAVVKAALAKKR